eukprot:g13289.t1
MRQWRGNGRCHRCAGSLLARERRIGRRWRHVAEILATTGPAKQEDRYSNVVGLERPAPNTEFSGADGNSAFVLFLNEVALVEGDDPEQERKQREGAESNGVGAGAASKPPDDQAHDGPRLEGTGVRYGFRDRLRHGASPWKDTAEYVVEEGRLMCVNGHRGSWWAYRCPTPSMSRGQVVGMVGRSEAVNVRISSGGGGFVTRMLAHSGTAIHGVNLSPSARSTTTLPPTPPSWSSSGTRVPAVPTQASTPPPFLKRGRSPAYGLFAATSPATASTAPSPWGTPSSWVAPPSHSSTAQPPVMATPRVACTASSGMTAAVTPAPSTATGKTAVAAPKMVGGFVGWAPTNDGTSGPAPLAAPAVCNPPATASIGGAHTPVAGGIRGSTATATATAGPNPSPASRPASDAAASLAVSASSASSEIGSAHVDVLADMLSSTLKIENTTSPQVTAASDASRKAFDNLMEVDTNADTDATAMMAQALALKMAGLSLKGVGGSKGDHTPSTEEVSAESAFVRAMRAAKEEQSRERLANMMQADPMDIEPDWMDVEEQSTEGLATMIQGDPMDIEPDWMDVDPDWMEVDG